jgi:hypothetical protein
MWLLNMYVMPLILTQMWVEMVAQQWMWAEWYGGNVYGNFTRRI